MTGETVIAACEGAANAALARAAAANGPQRLGRKYERDGTQSLHTKFLESSRS